MSDSTKRSLRARRPPSYLSPDNEDHEHAGYPRSPYMRQFISPAQELNQNAKLLAKFINSVNKKYIQHCKNEAYIVRVQKNEIPLVQQNLYKKNETTKQGGKKRITTKEQTKNDSHRQQKSLQDPKEQGLNKQASKNQQINRFKPEKLDSQKKQPIINRGLNSKYSNIINAFNNQRKITTFPQLQASQMNQIATQQQLMVNSRLNPKKKPIKPEQPQPQTGFNRQKVFGKASFHLAIAYYIHIQNLIRSGVDINSSDFVDPTYRARMKKGNIEQDKSSKK